MTALAADEAYGAQKEFFRNHLAVLRFPKIKIAEARAPAIS